MKKLDKINDGLIKALEEKIVILEEKIAIQQKLIALLEANPKVVYIPQTTQYPITNPYFIPTTNPYYTVIC